MLEASGSTSNGSGGTAVEDPPFDGGRTPGEKVSDKANASNAKFSTGTGGALLAVTTQAYESISDPVEWAKVTGQAIHLSGMFGCVNAAQGYVMAMDAFTRRVPILEYAQTYHIVEGKLTMKADSILARFIEAGNRIQWKDLGEEGKQAVAIFWDRNNNKYTIGYTIEEAKLAGLVKPNSNWVKRPGEMLRARLCSKAIRIVDPGCIKGVYTPEDFETSEDGPAKLKADTATMVPVENVDNVPPVVRRIETTATQTVPVTLQTQAPAADVASVPSATTASAPTKAFAQQLSTLADLVNKLQMPPEKYLAAIRKRGVERAEDLTVEQAVELIKRLDEMLTAKGNVASTPQMNIPVTPGAPGYATGDQMNRLIELRKQLQMPDAAWQAVLSKRGLNSAHELKTEDAADIISKLEAKLAASPAIMPQPVDPRAIDAQRKTDDLSAWASGATLPNQQGRPQTAAPGPSNG